MARGGGGGKGGGRKAISIGKPKGFSRGKGLSGAVARALPGSKRTGAGRTIRVGALRPAQILRFRGISIKSLVGGTKLKRGLLRKSGATALARPLRVPGNIARTALRRAGYFHPALKLGRAAMRKAPRIGALGRGRKIGRRKLFGGIRKAFKSSSR